MKRLTTQDLKKYLDKLYLYNNKVEFTYTDPVKFPRRYKSKRDKEISAFISATIAWGRRDMILRSCEKIFMLMGNSPYSYIMEEKYKNLRKRPLGRSLHRTFFEEDLLYLCKGFNAYYSKNSSLETLFASTGDLWEGIGLFRDMMADANKSYSKHVANPASSACKRLFLALRWLVRREGPVDLGLWKGISPSSLYIPLDVHVGRVARQLGLLAVLPAANNKKAVIALTEKLRELCPEDPIKYDLALFGSSVS